MDFELLIKKSDDFVGPTGWSLTFHKKLTDLSGNVYAEVFFLLHQNSQGIIDNDNNSAEVYFNEHIKSSVDNLLLGNTGSLENLVKSFVVYSVNNQTNLNVSVVVIASGKLYLEALGDIDVCIFRNGKFARVSPGANARLFFSGDITSKDVFLVSTASFFISNTPSEISALLYEVEKSGGLKTNKPFIDGIKKTPFLWIEIGEEISNPEDIIVHKGDYSGKINMKGSLSNMMVNKQGLGNFWSTIRGIYGIYQKRTTYGMGEDYQSNLKRRKNWSLVGITLLLILIVSIMFGIKSKRQADIKAGYEADLVTAEHGLTESLKIFSLNKNRSRELFIESRKLVEDLTQKDIQDSRLDIVKQVIEQNQGKILGEYKPTIENFVDLGLLTDNFKGDKINLTNDTLYVTDKSSRKIVKLILESKRSEVLAGPNKLPDIYDTASYFDRVFVINNEGIFEVSKTKEKVSDTIFSNNVIASVFAGNLYVLDKGESEIFRFAGDGKVFATRKNWLASGIDVNLSSAKSIGIDGSIWVLTDKGEVYKFVQGNKQTFSLDTDFINDVTITNFFTSDETQALYFLDHINGKIIVFTKEGEYIAQYIHNDLKDTTSIIVSESAKKIILLNENKLFSIELKHLD